MSVDPVIRELANALSKSHVASSPGLSAVLAKAVARSSEVERVSTAESLAFFKQLGRDLVLLRGTANAKERIECLFRACAYLWLHGECQEAFGFVRHAVALATSTNRLNDVRRLHTALGALYLEAGDHGLALQAYLRSLEIANKLKDSFGSCTAWNNLSALYVDAGLYTESIACGARCIQIAASSEPPIIDMAQRANNNIALAKFRLADYEGALAAARKSVHGLPEPKVASEALARILREEHLVLALIALGQFHEASERVAFMNQLVRKFPAPRQQLVVETVTGLIEVLVGNAQKGIDILERAVHIAHAKVPMVYSDALAALAHAYVETGDCERALEVTRRHLRHLEMIRIDTTVAKISAGEGAIGDISNVVPSNRGEIRRAEAELHAKVLQRELARSRQEMLERMAVAADIREDISGEHGYRVGRLSALLAKEIGWDRESCNALDIAARLHDIGKIGIPERILLDDKTLKEAEKHFIASHTLVGAEILSKSDIPQVRIAEEIARCHHEWWDGSGYPKKMQGVAIPKGARIVALADVFDAMTHGRPYAKAIPIDKALDEIASLRGRQFDPELTDHFLALVRRLARENEDLDAYLGKAARNSPFLKARAKIKEMLAQGRDSAALSIEPPPPGTPLN